MKSLNKLKYDIAEHRPGCGTSPADFAEDVHLFSADAPLLPEADHRLRQFAA